MTAHLDFDREHADAYFSAGTESATHDNLTRRITSASDFEG
jgi:hypothetical protein